MNDQPLPIIQPLVAEGNEIAVYDGRQDSIFSTGFFGGLYFRTFAAKNAGYVHTGHRHLIDHVSVLHTGRIRIYYRSGQHDTPYQAAEFIAPFCVEIKANVFHEIHVLEDNTSWSCCFSVQEGERVLAELEKAGTPMNRAFHSEL